MNDLLILLIFFLCVLPWQAVVRLLVLTQGTIKEGVDFCLELVSPRFQLFPLGVHSRAGMQLVRKSLWPAVFEGGIAAVAV